MNNISAFLEKTGEIHNLVKTIDNVLKTKPKALTIFAAAGNKFSKTELDPEDSARVEVDNELEKLNLKGEKSDAAFIFSCAHRDDADSYGYSKEIRMLNNHLTGSECVVGTLAMGEIATGKSRLLHLHNKSIVISRLTSEI